MRGRVALWIVLAAVLALAGTACGSEKEETAAGGEETAAAETGAAATGGAAE